MMKLRILLADADTVGRETLKALLTELGYDLLEAQSVGEVWQALQAEDAPQVAILDSSLTGIAGGQIARQLKLRQEIPFVYTILVGTAAQREEITKGIEAGADDFLFKPVDPLELEIRLRGGKRTMVWRERLRDSEQIIRFQASHDPLTGLLSRVVIIDVLQREITRVEREQGAVAVLMIGLDGLRKLNRSHDYAAGDQALRAVALRLTSIVRPYDSVGRYGGEVFLVIAPGCNEIDGVRQAWRLQAALSREAAASVSGGLRPLAGDNATWITLSIGVAAVEGGGEAAQLLHAAEEALKKARKAGGNCVESAAVTVGARRDHTALIELRRAG